MKILTLIIYFFSLSIFTAHAKEELLISGNIKGFNNNQIVVFCVANSNPNKLSIDTIVAMNGQFKFYKTIDEVTDCAVYALNSFLIRANGKKYLPETSIVKLILSPNVSLNVVGQKNNDHVDYEVTGDELNALLSVRRKKQLSTKTQFVKEDLRLDSLAFQGTSNLVLAKMDSVLTLAKNQNQLIDIAFVQANPNLDLSAYYLLGMPQDTFLKYVGVLKPQVLNGVFKEKLALLNSNYTTLQTIQNAQKKVTIGSFAPDFTLKSIEGTNIRLSQITGKYIVLDFWGSWCHWCMEGLPKMKAFYSKYKEKVEFIGIDVRDSESDWKLAVKKNALNWIQLKNLMPTDVPALYGVTGYPTKFILDKNHQILARVVGEDPVFYEYLDLYLKDAL